MAQGYFVVDRARSALHRSGRRRLHERPCVRTAAGQRSAAVRRDDELLLGGDPDGRSRRATACSASLASRRPQTRAKRSTTTTRRAFNKSSNPPQPKARRTAPEISNPSRRSAGRARTTRAPTRSQISSGSELRQTDRGRDDERDRVHELTDLPRGHRALLARARDRLERPGPELVADAVVRADAADADARPTGADDRVRHPAAVVVPDAGRDRL